jgi:predicted esterase
MIEQNKISTSKTGRYFSLGKIDGSKKIWFVFHGYGQRAEDFIKIFNVIQNSETLIIAPEALNKFYLHGFNGKVGTSWMTKENRDDEIKDYIKFINKVYTKIYSSLKSEDIDINVLGFSQGTHTAVRWLDQSKIKVNRLILWSGTFPHDCHYAENSKYWKNIQKMVVVGKEDRLIDSDKLDFELNYLKSQNLFVKMYYFEGGHEIKGDILKRYCC